MEECTREETGVGAAIAAGSQAEKGTWALFVLAANTTIIINTLEIRESILHSENFHVPSIRERDKATIIKTSPIRLVKAVRLPAL